MGTDITTTAARIRTLHAEAQSLAASAVDRAIEVGKLLAEAKAALPHGEFGEWVAEHCGFTDRTARRYMRLHAHRDALPTGVGVRGALEHLKTDTVSVLADLALAPFADGDPAEAAAAADAMRAKIDSARSCTDGHGRTWYAWTMAGGYSLLMAETETDDGGADYAFMRRPIPVALRDAALRMMGLAEPEGARWADADPAVCAAIHHHLIAMEGPPDG